MQRSIKWHDRLKWNSILFALDDVTPPVLHCHGRVKGDIPLVLQSKHLKSNHEGQTDIYSFGYSCFKPKEYIRVFRQLKKAFLIQVTIVPSEFQTFNQRINSVQNFSQSSAVNIYPTERKRLKTF